MSVTMGGGWDCGLSGDDEYVQSFNLEIGTSLAVVVMGTPGFVPDLWDEVGVLFFG